MPRLFDITMPIHEGMITYPGNPATQLRAHSRIAEGDDANVTSLSFGSHTGTHVDAPRHFFDDAAAVDQLPLETLIGPAVVVQLPDTTRAIGRRELLPLELAGETRVLLRTRNSQLLGDATFREDFAFLAEDGARYLLELGVRLVGIDYLSIEAFDADQPRTHHALLREGVVILEGADLRGVPTGHYELICLPLRIGTDGAPTRAVLRGDD
jgi:arylformamidase